MLCNPRFGVAGLLPMLRQAARCRTEPPSHSREHYVPDTKCFQASKIGAPAVRRMFERRFLEAEVLYRLFRRFASEATGPAAHPTWNFSSI